MKKRFTPSSRQKAMENYYKFIGVGKYLAPFRDGDFTYLCDSVSIVHTYSEVPEMELETDEKKYPIQTIRQQFTDAYGGRETEIRLDLYQLYDLAAEHGYKRLSDKAVRNAEIVLEYNDNYYNLALFLKCVECIAEDDDIKLEFSPMGNRNRLRMAIRTPLGDAIVLPMHLSGGELSQKKIIKI